MEEPGSIILLIFLGIVSTVILIWIIVRPCWVPKLKRFGANSAGHGAQPIPAGDPSHAAAGGGGGSSSDGSSVGVDALALHEDDDAASSIELQRFVLYQYRSYAAFTIIQAILFLLFLIAIGVNRWDSTANLYVDPVTGDRTTVTIDLGLTRRDVHNAPNDDARWSSGSFSEVCKVSSGLTGCSTTIQLTGVLVFIHALGALLAMALVLGYLLISRCFHFESFAMIRGWGREIWQLCLVQSTSAISAPLIWAMTAHTSLSQPSLEASWFLALFVGVATLPFLYCLHIVLLMLDSGSSQQWREMGLIENEIQGASSESVVSSSSASASASSAARHRPIGMNSVHDDADPDSENEDGGGDPDGIDQVQPGPRVIDHDDPRIDVSVDHL